MVGDQLNNPGTGCLRDRSIIFKSLLFKGFACAVALLASSSDAVFAKELPPIELFAQPSKIQDMEISPDGEHIALTYAMDDNEVRLAVATSDLKAIKASIGFGKNQHLGSHFWVNNDRIVVGQWRSLGNLDGSRNDFQWLSYNAELKDREFLFPPGQMSYIRIYSRLRKDPNNILVGKYHFADEGKVSIFKMNVVRGTMDYMGGLPLRPDSRIVDVVVDLEDEVRVAIEVDRGDEEYDSADDTTYLHYKDAGGQWQRLTVDQARRPSEYRKLGFGPENRRFYFLSNFDIPRDGPVRDTLGVYVFDFDSLQITPVFRHADVDVQAGIYGPDREVLGVRYEPGYPAAHYFFEDHPQVVLMKSLSATFPGEVATINNYSEGGIRAAVRVYSDRNPGSYYIWEGGKLTHVGAARPELDPESLGTTEPFIMRTRDGVKLYGHLTLPPGKEHRMLPMVVNPHGGPHGPYDRWGFDWRVQALASRGYAVLQVNFRGSGGYGSDFERSGHRQWGRKMQDDVTDATLWAINEGIADASRVCIYGGSYGGYASLQAVVREPDLYQCAIGVVGVYSLPLMWKKSDGRTYARAASNVWLDQFIGKDDDELRRYSPAFNVDKIKARLFIIHGSKDKRVPIDHAELLARQLDEAGKNYEWMVRAEGHGFTQVKNRVDQFNAMFEFLDRNIGERRFAAE